MALAIELKTGTKRSHTAAENTKFVGSFLRGVISEENYRTLIKDFYFVYSALEEEMERLDDDEFLKPIHFKELDRLNALKMDLRYYYGPNWMMEIKPSEACIQYTERIHEVADKDPYLLVGHHYTRYLGDLSGGQILKGIAEKALDLPKNEGLHFYDFPKIDDKKEFKTKYRAALDGLTTDSSKINDIIAEANYAFRLNMYMFDELSGTAKDAWNSAAKVFIQTMVGAFKKG
jgi:heme oxygenase